MPIVSSRSVHENIQRTFSGSALKPGMGPAGTPRSTKALGNKPRRALGTIQAGNKLGNAIASTPKVTVVDRTNPLRRRIHVVLTLFS